MVNYFFLWWPKRKNIIIREPNDDGLCGWGSGGIVKLSNVGSGGCGGGGGGMKLLNDGGGSGSGGGTKLLNDGGCGGGRGRGC